MVVSNPKDPAADAGEGTEGEKSPSNGIPRRLDIKEERGVTRNPIGGRSPTMQFCTKHLVKATSTGECAFGI